MIDFDKYYQIAFHFFSTNLLITVGIGVVIVFFLYKKPEATVKFIGFLGLMVAVLYIMSLLGESSSSGMLEKRTLMQKSEMEIIDSSK